MKSRRILGFLVALFFVGLVAIAFYIGLSDGLNSPADSARARGAEHWKLALTPSILDPDRPLWTTGQANAQEKEIRGTPMLVVSHLPLDLGGTDFAQWQDDSVDAIRTGKGKVQLGDGGWIEVTALGMGVPGADLVFYNPPSKRTEAFFELMRELEEQPVFYLEFKAHNTDVAQMRNVGIGCARVRRMERQTIRDGVIEGDEEGLFFAVIPAPLWHSIDPVIVTDVVYDCGEPTPIAFETGARVKIGETTVSLLAVSTNSLFLRSHKLGPDGRWEAFFHENTSASISSLIPIVDPVQPPDRLLFEAKLKYGSQFASRHFCPPARNAPIQSYRFEADSGEIEEVHLRIAKRVDRVVIRLPRIKSPAEPPEGSDNLFDLTLQSGIAENYREFENILGGITQCRIELVGVRELPSAPVNFSGMTGHEIFEFARTEFGHAAHDPDTHTITLGGEPDWFERFLAKGRQLLEDVGLK